MAIESNIGPIDIAISGLKAQNKQMEIISSNVANARTSDAGNGEPYRRLEAKFIADEDMGGVKIDNIVPDMSDFLKVLDPGNPMADGDGYISVEMGGLDLNDNDPTIYPGAPETSDEIDQNVDEADPFISGDSVSEPCNHPDCLVDEEIEEECDSCFEEQECNNCFEEQEEEQECDSCDDEEEIEIECS